VRKGQGASGEKLMPTCKWLLTVSKGGGTIDSRNDLDFKMAATLTNLIRLA